MKYLYTFLWYSCVVGTTLNSIQLNQGRVGPWLGFVGGVIASIVWMRFRDDVVITEFVNALLGEYDDGK